ncbi:MAG: glycosyltransferase [Acidimicrobiales bacterium]
MAGSLPRRSRDVVVRLLRQPRTMAELFADTHERMAAAEERVEARMEAARDETSAALTALGEQISAAEARTRESEHRAQVTVSAVLAHLASDGAGTLPDPGPLVSIVLPVRDRAEPLRRAVQSVLAQTYPRWELVVVDDGSAEPVATTLADLAEREPRVVVTTTPGVGPSGARNHGIARSTGELVAFLDSDNWWFPRRLENVVRALRPDTTWALDRQLIVGGGEVPPAVRPMDRPLSDLAEGNFIDLGSVVVRRDVLTSLEDDGPFDEDLPRLGDWDLVLRLAERRAPTPVWTIGHAYEEGRPDRVSATHPFGPSFHKIRRRVIGQPARGLRILASEWHFPQVTETYIHSDLAGLRAIGAEVEVWSDEGVAVPYEPGLPWRRGPLEEHLRDFRPHLVLSHWLNVGRDHRPITRALGIPHAVRCHGFDFDRGVVADLLDDPGVVVHLFPHLARGLEGRPNASVDPVAFDVDRVAPTASKDRRLVLRQSAGLFTKDLETFLVASTLCPEHRFVLVIGHTYQVEERTEALAERVKELGAPVEVLTDLSYEKSAALTMDAGIYLHTHGTDHPLGQPISVVEAMASGALTLTRDLDGAEVFRGAVRYRGDTVQARAEHAAEIINDTLTWDDERWARQARRALDDAWVHHPSDLVAERLLRVWRERLGVGR